MQRAARLAARPRYHAARWLHDIEFDYCASFTRFMARIAAEGTKGWSNLMLQMMFASDHDHLSEHSGGQNA